MAHIPFSGTVPDDRFYSTRYDMWVQLLPRGELRIGATAFGLFLSGELIAFTSKPKGAVVDIGRGMGTVESRKTVQAIHAPVSFTLLEGNEAAEERPRLVNADPYGAGWLAHGTARCWEVELPLLVDAAGYRAHILKVEPEATFV